MASTSSPTRKQLLHNNGWRRCLNYPSFASKSHSETLVDITQTRRNCAIFRQQSNFTGSSYCEWRPEPESNRRARICSPLRHHSAIGPQSASLRFWPASGKWAAVPALFPAHCHHLPQTGAIAADRTIASRKIAPPLSAYLRGKDFHCALQKSYRSRQCQLLCCMDNTVMPSGIS